MVDEVVHVGDMISIFWDGDRQWYNGKVLSYDEASRDCKVLYDDGEVEKTNLKETKYRIIRNRSKDSKKLILEDGETEMDNSELMKSIGKLVLDCEDRLPLEAVKVNSKVWWQDWRKETSAAAKSGDVPSLTVAVRKFALQLKPNVTTSWWKSQGQTWRDTLELVEMSSELQASVKSLLTKAIDWVHARELFSSAKIERCSLVEAGKSSADADEQGSRKKCRKLNGSGPVNDHVFGKILDTPTSDGSCCTEPKLVQESHHESSVKHLTTDELQRLAELDVDCSLIKATYGSDSDFKDIYNLLCKGQSSLKSDQSASNSSYSLQGGLLFMNKRLCIVKNTDLRNQLIKRLHCLSENDHLSIGGTVDSMRSKYYWPGLELDVQNHISDCTLCQQQKELMPSIQNLSGAAQASQTWDTVIIKLLSGLPISSAIYDSVFVVVDSLSKQAHFLPCDHDVSAVKLAQIYFKEVVRLHGIPKTILCENIAFFHDKGWEMLWESFGVRIDFDSSMYTDIEQIVEKLLRTHAESQHEQWSDSLHLVEFSFNSSNSTSASCPFKVLYGYDLQAPRPFTMEIVEDANASKFLRQMTDCLKQIKLGLATAQRDTSFDPQKITSLNPPTCSGLFQAGDKVSLRVSSDLFGATMSLCSSLYPSYFGPFEVKEVFDADMYEVDIPDSWKVSKTVHISRIKPYCVTEEHIRVHEVRVESESGGRIELEPEQILGSRFKQIHEMTVVEYLIQWRGLSSNRATWESDVSPRWFSLEEFLSYQSG